MERWWALEIQFGSWEHMLMRFKNVFFNVKKSWKKLYVFIAHPNATCNFFGGKHNHFDQKQVERQMLRTT